MKRVAAFAMIFVLLIVILLVYLSISRKQDTSRLVLSGMVEAGENNLAFRIPGQLTAVNFSEGEHVDSGAVTAELDKTELIKVLDQARKTYQAAEASIKQLEVSLETVERNLEKIGSLISSGAATQNQYDDLYDQKRQVEAQLNFARRNEEALQSSVELAEVRLSYAEIISHTSGTVLDRMYEPGEVIMAGSPILTIADLEDLTVRIYVPEVSLGKIILGQTVSIEVDSHPGKTFPGTVSYISDKAEFTPKNVQTKEERVKQVFGVDIETTSHDGVIKPGMPCDVIIAVE